MSSVCQGLVSGSSWGKGPSPGQVRERSSQFQLQRVAWPLLVVGQHKALVPLSGLAPGWTCP